MRVFVDTSALLALLDASDEHHQAAARLFGHLGESADELVTHNYVSLEAIALVRSRLGREATADLVDRLIPSMTTEWVDGGVHDAALEAWRARGWTGSFVDQVSFVVMRRLAITHAFAFDRDFEAAGFTRPAVLDQDRPRLSEEPATYVDVGVANIVSVSEIARRSGRAVSTVQSWRRRHTDFPAAIADLAAGPIWNWDEVDPWIKRRAAPPRHAA